MIEKREEMVALFRQTAAHMFFARVAARRRQQFVGRDLQRATGEARGRRRGDRFQPHGGMQQGAQVLGIVRWAPASTSLIAFRWRA